jgi:hypothetical protein
VLDRESSPSLPEYEAEVVHIQLRHSIDLQSRIARLSLFMKVPVVMESGNSSLNQGPPLDAVLSHCTLPRKLSHQHTFKNCPIMPFSREEFLSILNEVLSTHTVFYSCYIPGQC